MRNSVYASPAQFGMVVLAIFIISGAQGLGQDVRTAKASAPIDLTGYWVSVITQDWRWRMVSVQGRLRWCPDHGRSKASCGYLGPGKG